MDAYDKGLLKARLNRALRRQKIRALLLIAPLLLFIMITFVIPIGQMLFRSVENGIVSNTIPETVAALENWDTTLEDLPSEEAFEAIYRDLFFAAQAKVHTRLGSRLNYEQTGTASLFRKMGRALDDIGEDQVDALEMAAPSLEQSETWAQIFLANDGDSARTNDILSTYSQMIESSDKVELALPAGLSLSSIALEQLPKTAREYAKFAAFVHSVDGDSPAEEDPWEIVLLTLALEAPSADLGAFGAEDAAALNAAAGIEIASFSFKEALIAEEEDWADPEVWSTIKTFSGSITSGYFLTSVDLQLTPDGVVAQEEDQRIYVTLFVRTMIMSIVITLFCILLGYPVAWLLANLPMRTANMLMILVLLPFWTSLLVRTSAWKALLQNQGVINDLMVWIGMYADDNRLALINNATGTIIAMTHILLPFMILPLYSVMKTIPPSYLRAAKSLGATNWTAFWRVYFPQSVPGIGAGSILVFILAIGYYITPEIVGGTKGVFISNRIAYHISSSLNWGLAAALGTILLVLVLALYWLYDRIVGIDNVKLGG
jgi:putative spermidine/putrescine transport system permease protein